jgi:carbonic anhydrase/acetyltransferase-like protein (isoleucine patch superfamily)
MLIEHDGKKPTVHATATIAANAVLCGDVTVGAHTWIGFGAILNAETGPVFVGETCVVMEHAVLRGTSRAAVRIGNSVLIGPHAHLSGCEVADDVFIASHACVFPHARIGAGSAVRIGAVVHIRTVLPPASSLPIYWIAVGDPPELFPPDEQEQLLDRLQKLDFVATVFGVERKDAALGHMPEAMRRYARALERHRGDCVLEGHQRPAEPSGSVGGAE